MKDLLSGLIALLLAFGGGYWYGKHVEAKAQQIEVNRLNTIARTKEEALANAVNTTADALRKSNEKAKTAAKERDIAIDNGALQLRIPVQASCPIQATTDTAPASGDSRAATAQLDPAFGKALFALTEEGDKAIKKLNACVDLYNKAIESQKELK